MCRTLVQDLLGAFLKEHICCMCLSLYFFSFFFFFVSNLGRSTFTSVAHRWQRAVTAMCSGFVPASSAG